MLDKWEVLFTHKAEKQADKLPKAILSALSLLVESLTEEGPWAVRTWPNYGKLRGKSDEDKYHCHIKKGKPTYVCCWELLDKTIKIIEVYYVGTHENAPY